MDKNFLEFWGNVFLGAAKGQQQIEDLGRWMQQGFKGFEDLSAMFGKFYGLDQTRSDEPEAFKAWEHASEEFRKSFADYLSLMGVVPRQDHLALLQKYEGLKQKIAEQAETIEHLRTLLGENQSDQGKAVEGLQELVKKQNQEFQGLMNSLGQYFQESAAGEAREKKK